jgi:menaquinone-dependent protoporphyrinogen oxidase
MENPEPMNVLVAVASKHGSSLEIGQVIETTLRSAGLEVDLRRLEDAPDPSDFDAAVLGSGVYSGHWMRAARDYIDAHEARLNDLPVWLFSSGPVGDPPKPLENPAEVATVVKRIDARGHRLFGGKIDGSELRVAEKALIALVRAEQGDFRPWSEISVWADSIAAALMESPA